MLPVLPAAGPEPAAQQKHSSRQHHSETAAVMQQSWRKTFTSWQAVDTEKRAVQQLCHDALKCAAQPQPAAH
jgi:hypothetical protein